jgi:hypothetical protein
MPVRFQGMNSGDREGGTKTKNSGGMVGPPEPGTSRYAVGLAIPHPVARLQSRTPLRQARPVYLVLTQPVEGDHEQSEWNDGFVASWTGPGGRT